MSTQKSGRICWAVAASTLFVPPGLLSAQTAATPAKAGSQESAAQRDGQHDFDPLVGTWRAKLKRLVHPLSGSTTWIEFEGTQVTRSVWGGRATMDEFHVDSPSTNTHIDGLTLRLYNPESHQWHIYWANAKKGILDLPPVVGHFNNGRAAPPRAFGREIRAALRRAQLRRGSFSFSGTVELYEVLRDFSRSSTDVRVVYQASF